jgi:predicted nuclease of predicted toxin-antitoxin system
MKFAFLIDNQLPAELVHFFRNAGLDCQHVLDLGLSQASESQICRYATETGPHYRY